MVRRQFKEVIVEAIQADPSLAKLEKAELYRKAMTLEVVQDLDYMNKVMLEALRIQNPANNGMPLMLVKDSKIGNYDIKAHDELIVNYQGI